MLPLRVSVLEAGKENDNASTPVRNTELDVSNGIINSMKKRAASTAMRPRLRPHFREIPIPQVSSSLEEEEVEFRAGRLSLESSDESSDVAPSGVIKPSELLAGPLAMRRRSSLWLEDIISEANVLADQIKNDRQLLDSRASVASDLSSLGILTQSAMEGNFTLGTCEPPGHASEKKTPPNVAILMDSGVTVSTSQPETDMSNSELKPSNELTRSFGAPAPSWNGSDLGATEAMNFSMNTLDQQELGFDSKDFEAHDLSDVKALLDKGEESFMKEAKKEAIPSPQRIDLNECSGLIGDGEVTLRSSWLSPEKRDVSSKRLTIGQYFSLKSAPINELSSSLNAEIEKSAKNKKRPEASPLPTGPRPEFVRTSGTNETIDLTDNEDDTLVKSEGSSDSSGDDDINMTAMCQTLFPGCPSIMSLTAVARILDSSNQGSETMIHQMLNAAGNLRQKKTKPQISPITPTSRETFLISPSQNSKENLENHDSPVTNKSPARGKRISLNRLSTSGASQVKTSPDKKLPLKSPSSPCSPVSKKSPTSARIQLPLKLEGEHYGVVGVPLTLQVPVTNISMVPICCSIVYLIENRHVELDHSSVFLQPGSSETLDIQATALISGHHCFLLGVSVSDGTNALEQKTVHLIPDVELFIEDPQVSLISEFRGTLDFGLQPENSQKCTTITVKNHGSAKVPVHISLVNEGEASGFYFLLPSDDSSAHEFQLGSHMSMWLAGSSQPEEPCEQQIGVAFLAPEISSLTENCKQDRTMMRGTMRVSLEKPEDEEGRTSELILAECMVQGEIGLTQILVSQNELTLRAGCPQSLGVRNGGVVPLRLNFRCRYPENNLIDDNLDIVPSSALLLSGDEVVLSLTWKGEPGQTAPVDRELLFNCEDLVTENIVSLKCHPLTAQPALSKVGTINANTSIASSISGAKKPLPLKTTRTQLAWGSVAPGQTKQQSTNFQNMGVDTLELCFSIHSVDDSDNVPFKLLTDEKELATQLEVQIRPGSILKLFVVFCPQRPGPASAFFRISAPYHAHRQILLTGFGGQAELKLGRVAVLKDEKWLTLFPGLGDHVSDNFYVSNLGNLPVFVKIAGTSIAGNCQVLIKPDVFLIAPRGKQDIHVRLSNVSQILSQAHCGEVKTLAKLDIYWCNEVSRRRIRRLLPQLNSRDRTQLLQMEKTSHVLELVDIHLEEEDSMLPSANLASLVDCSGPSAVMLISDFQLIPLELRATGTGANQTSLPEASTLSPFVSFAETYSSDQPEFGGALQDQWTEKTDNGGWTVSPRDVTLHVANKYSTVVHVCNLSARNVLSLQVEALDELAVTPSNFEVQPCMTASLQVRLKNIPRTVLSTNWPSAIKVYSANEVESLNVKVIPPPPASRIMSSSGTLSTTSSSSLPYRSAHDWITPNSGKIFESSTKSQLSASSSSSLGNTEGSQLVHKISSTANTISSHQPSVGIPKVAPMEGFSPISTISFGTGKFKGVPQREEVFVDSCTLNFPWTHIKSSSSIKLTIFNQSNAEKQVSVKSILAPFSVDHDSVVVPAKWHKSLSVTFSPLTPNNFTKKLELSVEGRENLLCVLLKGPSIFS